MPTIIPIPAFTDNYIWRVCMGHKLAGAVEASTTLRAWKNEC